MSSDIDNNLSSSGNLSSSIILKEEFDETFEVKPEGKSHFSFTPLNACKTTAASPIFMF